MELCTCAYDKLESELGKKGLVNLSIDYDRTGVMPDSVINIIQECI